MKYITHNQLASGFEIPAGALLLWGDVVEPEGYIFETDLDDYFVIGYETADIATARGAATHSHTNPALNSTGTHNDHTASSTSTSHSGSNNAWNSPGSSKYVPGHTHTISSLTGQTAAGGHTHTPNDTDTASNLPKYVRLRWIRAGAQADAPVGAIVMQSVSATALGDDWKVCDGTDGTPDMRGYFVYGGTGADGGADSHSHTSPDTESAGGHVHNVNVTTNQQNEDTRSGSASPGVAVAVKHTHTAIAQSSSGGAHTHDVGVSGTDTVLPPYIQLYFVQRMR